jgi:hypothetical protein
MEVDPHHRQTEHRHRVASARISLVLDLEGSSWKNRQAQCSKGNSRIDPNDEPRKRSLGRTPHSQRVAQAWHQDLSGLGCQVHGTKTQITFAKLEDIPQQSRGTTCLHRLLHRSNRDVSSPVCVPVIKHDRRRVVHFNITEHPTAAWTAQQIIEAFPFDTVPKDLLRDRDGIYGLEFCDQVQAMNIDEVLSAPRSPWQRAYVEPIIGSIRRECLDHILVLNEESLRRTLRDYFAYYHGSRLHLSLGKDSPDSRAVESEGVVISIPEVGGLHHCYRRRAA